MPKRQVDHELIAAEKQRRRTQWWRIFVPYHECPCGELFRGVNCPMCGTNIVEYEPLFTDYLCSSRLAELAPDNSCRKVHRPRTRQTNAAQDRSGTGEEALPIVNDEIEGD